MASTPAAAATENVENGSATAPGSDTTPDTSNAAAAETTAPPTDTGAVKTDGEEATVEATPAASEAAQPETAAPAQEAAVAADKKWPGWPGHCVFRLVVPVLKVGSIIGRKGELIKKMCEETKAKIRVLDGPVGNPDRIVLISGKEEPEAPLSPAMDAVIRVFKRVSGLSEGTGDSEAGAAAFCTIRLLVASTQAINLIGRQGSSIKSIQEGTGATIRVLSNDDGPSYATPDERIVEVQGETSKVLKALEGVVGHLRKFLVDQSVLPLFEKIPVATPPPERQADAWADKPLHHAAPQSGLGPDYPLSSKRDSLYFERESLMEQHLPSSGISMYGQDPGLPGVRSSGISRAGGPIVTQMSQTMQIPLAYAEDIIGVGGANIAYIRRSSGAILTVQESRGLPDEITVEIKGTSSQVQTAQQLIQEFISSHKEPASSVYGKIDGGGGYRSSYSQMGDNPYASSLSGPPYGGGGGGGYGSSGLGGGGYSSYRL